MKFSCERCQTRYSIGDEKVRGKVLKIRCKTCGNIIVVREAQQAVAEQPAVAAAAAAPQPTQPRAPVAQRPPEVEWYVAIKGKQHGPCKKDEVVRLYRDGKITDRTYLWNEGMSAWTRLKEVSTFAGLLAEPPPKAKPPPPPVEEPQQHSAEIIPFEEVKRARFSAAESAATPSMANDPFAAVSQPALGGDQAPRDSTRVFIMQAGLANRSKKHRVYAAVAGGVFVVVAGLLALDYGGVVEIPGLHNVVVAVAPKTVVAGNGGGGGGSGGGSWDEGEEDPALKCKLNPANYDECIKKAEVLKKQRAFRRAVTGNSGPGVDLNGAFNTGGDASSDLHKGDTGPLAGGGALSDIDRQKLAVLAHDEKKASLVKLHSPTENTPQIDGNDLDPKNVAAVVKQNEPAIQDCIEKAAKTGSLPKGGKQWLVVSVEPNGRVSNARFKDGVTQQSEAGECIVKNARKWKFAAFPGPTTDAEIPLIMSLN
jgi:predicted Zn finger-like uncharacterized protein